MSHKPGGDVLKLRSGIRRTEPGSKDTAVDPHPAERVRVPQKQQLQEVTRQAGALHDAEPLPSSHTAATGMPAGSPASTPGSHAAQIRITIPQQVGGNRDHEEAMIIRGRFDQVWIAAETSRLKTAPSASNPPRAAEAPAATPARQRSRRPRHRGAFIGDGFRDCGASNAPWFVTRGSFFSSWPACPSHGASTCRDRWPDTPGHDGVRASSSRAR